MPQPKAGPDASSRLRELVLPGSVNGTEKLVGNNDGLDARAMAAAFGLDEVVEATEACTSVVGLCGHRILAPGLWLGATGGGGRPG